MDKKLNKTKVESVQLGKDFGLDSTLESQLIVLGPEFKG